MMFTLIHRYSLASHASDRRGGDKPGTALAAHHRSSVILSTLIQAYTRHPRLPPFARTTYHTPPPRVYLRRLPGQGPQPAARPGILPAAPRARPRHRGPPLSLDSALSRSAVAAAFSDARLQAKTAEMLRETVPLLTRLSLSLVPAHREAGVGAGARVLVAALPHLRELQIRYLWEGNVRADQALRPPRKLGEFEVLSGRNLVTLFEGKLRDTVTMRGEFGRLQLRRPDPAMRRRHFPSHGWRWYVTAIDKPRRAADPPGEVTMSLQHAAPTSAACERVSVFVILGVLVGFFAAVIAARRLH
jgi:hypothetical protein